MDFKVTGSDRGITAPIEHRTAKDILEEVLHQAKKDFTSEAPTAAITEPQQLVRTQDLQLKIKEVI